MGADGDEQRLAAPVLRVMALSPVACSWADGDEQRLAVPVF